MGAIQLIGFSLFILTNGPDSMTKGGMITRPPFVCKSYLSIWVPTIEHKSYVNYLV